MVDFVYPRLDSLAGTYTFCVLCMPAVAIAPLQHSLQGLLGGTSVADEQAHLPSRLSLYADVEKPGLRAPPLWWLAPSGPCHSDSLSSFMGSIKEMVVSGLWTLSILLFARLGV